jgi:hypothetical protein
VLERDATGFFEDVDATFNERHSEPPFDGGEDGAVAPASDVAPEETAPGRTHDEFTDEPSDEPGDAMQTPGASTLASDGPNYDEPSVRDPAEPTAVAPSGHHVPGPGPVPAPEPVRRAKTTDEIPVRELTPDELKRYAPDVAALEYWRQRIEAIYGPGSDPGQRNVGRGPPAES